MFPQQIALLDRNGTHPFFLAAECLGRHGIYRQGDSVGQIEVKTTTLDEFFSGRKEKVQVIKLDAEGAEPLIIKGMEDVISGSERLALFTELFPPNLQAGGHSPEAYRADLARYGFDLYLLNEEQKSVQRVESHQLIEICRQDPEPV